MQVMSNEGYNKELAYCRKYNKENRELINAKQRLRNARIADELRQQIKSIFGDKCQVCGSQKNLQLHHKYYAADSVLPKSHNENGSRSIARKKEAIAHPERFMLTCLSCHNRIEPKGYNPHYPLVEGQSPLKSKTLL